MIKYVQLKWNTKERGKKVYEIKRKIESRLFQTEENLEDYLNSELSSEEYNLECRNIKFNNVFKEDVPNNGQCIAVVDLHYLNYHGKNIHKRTS